ncbi:cytoskeletal protein CcmA (bactofilin family) [Sediminitomix flava]|uniref:Cytoskeletal protein CcmA (Bactofilin family) n=2 Tax=Sediminitomix flava TaxID=379075 RepID=A0A315ZHM5_SEDFL|nr:cytoskeletal protein CcmA (bactofilin family) [Sediminitomix flava]
MAVQDMSQSTNQIAKGTKITGDIETSGIFRLDGELKGNILSKSKVAMGPGSVVEGDLVAKNAEIEGEVKGKVIVEELLVLKPSAVVHGNIQATKMIMESGAQFNGTCQMGPDAVKGNQAAPKPANNKQKVTA